MPGEVVVPIKVTLTTGRVGNGAVGLLSIFRVLYLSLQRRYFSVEARRRLIGFSPKRKVMDELLLDT